MSAKTKIVVVKMKHVILTGVLLGILLLLIIFAATYFFSGDEPKPAVEETGMYTPGVYNTSVALGGAAIDVSVAVDSNNINSISLENMTDSVETMYPLVEPAMNELVSQIVQNQSTDNISYANTSQYTSKVLLDAIDNTLSKAKNLTPQIPKKMQRLYLNPKKSPGILQKLKIPRSNLRGILT